MDAGKYNFVVAKSQRCFFFSILLSLVLIFQNTIADKPVKSAIVIDANTKDVLYSCNADKATQPASMAK